MFLQSINPFDNQIVGKYKVSNAATLNAQIDASSVAQSKWKFSTIQDRKNLAERIASSILDHKDALAQMAVNEMGKPIKQAYLEVEKCVMIANYYAANIEQILATSLTGNSRAGSYTFHAPIGLVLGIMPWNFPYWQVFRNLVPIILGGNGYVLKHASNVYGCAHLIAAVLKKAKVPKDLFQLLITPGSAVEPLIANPKIQAISFTGSTAVGSAVASIAGKYLKKCVLELGGNDGYGIFDDADIVKAVEACSYSRLINNGQSCLAAKRFIVHKKVHKAFFELLLHKLENISIGNPMDPEIVLGPMARIDLRDELHKQVLQSSRKGALIYNKRKVPKDGAFYAPIILDNVKNGMPAYHQELFGPVSSIISSNNNKDIVQTINDSIFGLGACIFTSNKNVGQKIAELELEAGNCFVNDFVRSVPDRPFGGIKQSGYGRELGSWGVLEFMNIKSVFVAE